MKPKNMLRILLAFLFVFASTQTFAKTIKWSMQGDSLTLDPHAQNEGPTTQVSRQVYEALVTRGLDMSIEPQLATDWKTTDPNTWVFNLRKGVKFSDGTDMTAKDVVFSILRAKQPTSDFKEYISTISDVKEIDNYTVQVTTSKPNPILLNQLSNIFIMSKKWSIDFGATVSQNWDGGEETFSATNAMGTGPFKITLREPNTKTVFERNSNWWGSMKDKGVTEIHLLPIKNSATSCLLYTSDAADE